MRNTELPDAIKTDERFHRNYIWFLLIALAAGSEVFALATGPLSIYPYRFAVMSGMLYYAALLLKNKGPVKIDFSFALPALIVFMIVYGGIHSFWVEYKSAAVKELGNLVFGFAFVFSFQQAWKQLKEPWEFLQHIFYWPLGFILAFSFFEIATKSHLPSPYATEILITDPIHFVRLSPSATFGNPNHLGIFLVLSFFILFNQIINQIHLQKALIFLFLTLIVLWFTLSRFGLMAVFLPILYLPFHFKHEIIRSFKNQKRNWLGLGFLILGTGLIVVFHQGFTGGIFAAKGEGAETPVVDPMAKSSRTVRTNMLKNGWEITKESNFLGVGPGQFSELMKYEPQKFETFGFTDPHSGAIEIISQYGILSFLLWAFWGVGVLFICIKGLKTEPAYWLTPLFMAIAFIPVSAANSSFLASPLTWAYVGILHILVAQKLPFSPSQEGKTIR